MKKELKNNLKNELQDDHNKKIRAYEKPEIHPEQDMNFMFQSMKSLPAKIACRQCSSCHACR